MNRPLAISVIGGLLLVCSRSLFAADADPKRTEFFEKRVRPILVNRCYDCHSEDSIEGELRLDSLAAIIQGGTRGPAIVIGDPKKSLLISAIEHSDRLHMPPKEKLPRKQIKDLTEWIRTGAHWPNAKPIVTAKKTEKSGPLFTEQEQSFWAFQRPRKSPLPVVKDRQWGASPIDAFILAKLEAAGMTPAAQADKRTLIRRATVDLTGLLPTPEHVRVFLADDSPNAFEKVVNRLLDSPRYGERWGRHWLDIARYADSNGLDENLAYANAYRYRDYVIAAFNKDKPYDRFVQEQLAGDLLTVNDAVEAQLEGLTATGFLSIGAKMLAEDDPVKMQMDIIDEQIDTMGQAILGLTLGCARCHAHKFDPVPVEDYYSLAGIFKSTKTMENFSVVARWQERPLAGPEEIAKRDAQQKTIDEKKSAIAQRIQQANQKLLAEERKHSAEYLLAAEAQRRLDALIQQARSVGKESEQKKLSGLIVFEAENFTRGNVLKSFTGYGEGIGVIYNKGEYPNFAEYDFDLDSGGLKSGGLHQLEIRYAAAAARPVKLIINGELVKSDAAGKTTGSWNPDTQTWMLEGIFRLKAGKNTIRLECKGPFPHFDKLLIVPALNAAGKPEQGTTAKKPADYEPKQEIVRQWVAYLKKSEGDAKSPFAEWHRFVSGKEPVADPLKTLEDLAKHYASLLTQIDTEWLAFKQTDAGKKANTFPDPQKEALRMVLYAPAGPFALPKEPEPYYPEATRIALKQQRETLSALEKALPVFPVAMSVSEDTPQNLRVHIRGSHTTLGKEVPRQFLQIMAGEHQKPIENNRSGRLELAQWLGSPEHPLTARVMINRIWKQHFGTGIVRSPDNFGRLGDRPTHPELLDWLAVQFVEQGWSIKAMHRLIMLSSTYQMSTAFNKNSAESDPENKLYWRANRRRLEAEAIRDSILAVAGTLDLNMGGSMLPTANRKYVTSTANVDPVAYKTNRRSVYLPVVRSALYDVFQAFDFADPSVLSGKRVSTTVAPQALFMMNSEIVSEQTKALAESLLADQALNEATRIQRLFELAFSRPATQQEIDRALAYIEHYAKAMQAMKKTPEESRLRAWQSYCRVIIASNEFIYVE